MVASVLANRWMFASPVFSSNEKLLRLCTVVSIVLLFLFLSTAVYAIGFGGLISEKLIDRSGIADSNLLIGRSGVSNSGLQVGMSGIATIGSATNVYMDGAGTHATLNANLTTLNGLPQVIGYFEWGYDTSYGHTSTTSTLIATGAFSIDISGFDPGERVYYRGVIDGDGRSYTSGSSFVTEGAIATGFNMLNAVVPIVYIAMIIFTVIVIGMKSTVVALLFMAVAIYIGEAGVIIIQEALRNVFGG